MRRIALFSDIHGNLPALDAVLGDIVRTGIEELCCLGDLVGYGPDPAGVVDRIRDSGIPTVLGNYDDGIGNRRGSCGCYYATPEARADGAASYDFTVAAIDDERAAWLAALPREVRFEHDGVRVLMTHGSPRKVNEYLLLDRSDRQLAMLATAANADVVCIGHVHIPYHRVLAGMDGPIHYVSSGSVGKPKDGDPRACWVELLIGSAQAVLEAADGDAAADGANGGDTFAGVRVHRVTYDVERVAQAILHVGLPDRLAASLRSG